MCTSITSSSQAKQAADRALREAQKQLRDTGKIDLESLNNSSKQSKSFPLKLFYLVTHEDPSIVGWKENGIEFQVRDQQMFTEVVLPHHFKHSNFTSFQRQLNLYGFRRSRETDKGSYFHPQFQRGQKHLALQIKRLLQGSEVAAGEGEAIVFDDSDGKNYTSDSSVDENDHTLDEVRDHISVTNKKSDKNWTDSVSSASIEFSITADKIVGSAHTLTDFDVQEASRSRWDFIRPRNRELNTPEMPMNANQSKFQPSRFSNNHMGVGHPYMNMYIPMQPPQGLYFVDGKS